MTKKTFIAVFVCISLALMGCAKNIGVYDSSIPQEQLCTLKIDSDIFVRQFDSSKVKWNQSFPQLGVVVQIPAGHHTFLMDYDGSSRSYTRYATNIRYSYTFEAGKTYAMKAVVSSGRVSIEVKTE